MRVTLVRRVWQAAFLLVFFYLVFQFFGYFSSFFKLSPDRFNKLLIELCSSFVLG